MSTESKIGQDINAIDLNEILHKLQDEKARLNVNCPYPVKKGQTITVKPRTTIACNIHFAPCLTK